jgi:uncharacterized protein YggE
MKKIITLVFVISFITNFAQTGQKNFIDVNYIEVAGKAEMEVAPNEIFLEIYIDEKDYKGKQSLEDLERLMNEKLIGIGINVSKDLAIKDLTSNFKNYWIKRKKIYTSKEYQLLVTDANTAGLVFQELESIGISNIIIDKINHSEIQKFKSEVKVNAIQAAKSKATSLANAIDQSIGKAIFIQEIENINLGGQVAGLSNIVVTSFAIRMEKELQSPIIEFEKIKLEYSILARFELK